jgi:hypothetical protein
MQYELFGELPHTDFSDYEGKTCLKCKTYKPHESFRFASGAKYRDTTCSSCSKELAITLKEIRKTQESPDNHYCCPICLRNKEQLFCATKPNKSVWSLDHHHEKQVFRGWLCHACNRGLGLLKDTVENLERATEYLKRV